MAVTRFPAGVATGAADAQTAKASGTASNSTLLAFGVNTITTVASAGDGVLLPPSLEGGVVIVFNNAANSLKVFGNFPLNGSSTRDTITGVAGATGISIAGNSGCLFACSKVGAWQVFGLNSSNSSSSQTLSTVTTGITAFATGGKTNATALGYGTNVVGTVATAADSVKLPAAVAGVSVLVFNSASNAMQVFGQGTDTINGVATGTGISQGGNSGVMYVCATAGAWLTVALGVGSNAATAIFSGAATLTTGNKINSSDLLFGVKSVAVTVTATANTDIPVTLPTGANVLFIRWNTTTAFTGATVTAQVGATAGGTEYVAAVDVKGAQTLVMTLVASANLQSFPAGPNNFNIRVAQTTPTAVGAATCHIMYAVP